MALSLVACGGMSMGGAGQGGAPTDSDGAAGSHAGKPRGSAGGTSLPSEPGAPVVAGSGGASSSRPSYVYGGDSGNSSYGFGGDAGAGQLPPGGAAGDPIGSDASCASPALAPLTDWQARTIAEASVATQLALSRRAVVGSWHGVVTTPWVAPYAVSVEFDDNGIYSAHCVQNSDYDGGRSSSCCRAFYYGSDRDSELKHWSLSSLNEDGTASGDLDIAFCNDGVPCYPPAWQGQLTELEYDATGNRLRFEFWTSDGYGPVQLDLERD